MLSGTVRDSAGIPQLGATVEVSSETPGVLLVRELLTNTEGSFRGEKLSPGLYTIRVTLAGFLPTVERHVRISSNLTTVVRVQLESMFSSIEELRRPPASGSVDPDDWKWVLRSASGLRPVLQWNEDAGQPASVVFDTPKPRPLGRIELTDGARRPGSVANIGAAPATAFAYDLPIDHSNHVVFAGQASYDEDTPSGGFAAVWLPTGASENGPQSTVVFREAKIAPDGTTFRGVRLAQSGTVTFGDRFLLRVGGEYVLLGVGSSSASTVRPRLKWETKVAPSWYVDLVYAALPNGIAGNEALAADLAGNQTISNLTTGLNQLDAFPALLWRGGKPVVESGRHEEAAAEKKLGSRGVVQVAAFHDDSKHVALFGRGNGLPSDEYFPDVYSKGFAYDGGSSSDWGGRAAVREKIAGDLELTAVYAFSGALVPTGAMDGALRDALQTASRQSLAAKVTAKVPKTGTHLSAGYKWINGNALSRIDPYGESLYDLSPYLHIGIRQPLPKFAVGRWEAKAECDNLLAQGYVPLNTREGQVLLVPAFRSFRGGLSLQF